MAAAGDSVTSCPFVHFEDLHRDDRLAALQHFQVFDDLREQAPVFFGEANGNEFWMPTRMAEIREILQNPTVYSNSSIMVENPDPPYMWIPEMLDAPLHTKWRQLLAPYFSPAAVAQLRPMVERRAEEIFDDVAGRTRYGRHDRGFAPGEPIEQARFAGIGRTCEHHLDAVSDRRGPHGFGKRAAHLVNEIVEPQPDLIYGRARDIRLVGEVNGRFHAAQYGDEIAAPGFDCLGSVAQSVVQGELALALGLRPHEIADAFGSHEVEPAVPECPPGELAGFRQPQACNAAQHIQEGAYDRLAAMEMKFGDIFARETVRTRKG